MTIKPSTTPVATVSTTSNESGGDPTDADIAGVPGYTTTPGDVDRNFSDDKPGSVVTPVPVGDDDKGDSLSVPTSGDTLVKPAMIPYIVTPSDNELAEVTPGPVNDGELNSVFLTVTEWVDEPPVARVAAVYRIELPGLTGGPTGIYEGYVCSASHL